MPGLEEEMTFKQELIKKGITNPPKGYQMIGDIVILNTKEESKELINAVKELVPSAKTICIKTGEITGEYREPQIKKLWGESTETTHHEHECKFLIDVTRVMWAKGNISERKRIANQPGNNENILDMFAGIGYFSIPLAKHNPTCKLISIEKNPVAHEYLMKNIKLNKLNNVTAINGNSMTDSPENWADRIIMGYIPEPSEFLTTAFKALKNKGVIHYEGIRSEGMEETLYEPVKKEGEKHDYTCKLLHTQKVKSYGPKRWHVVVDVYCEKC